MLKKCSTYKQPHLPNRWFDQWLIQLQPGTFIANIEFCYDPYLGIIIIEKRSILSYFSEGPIFDA